VLETGGIRTGAGETSAASDLWGVVISNPSSATSSVISSKYWSGGGYSGCPYTGPYTGPPGSGGGGLPFPPGVSQVGV